MSRLPTFTELAQEEKKIKVLSKLEIIYSVLKETPRPYPELNLGISEWTTENDDSRIEILTTFRVVIESIEQEIHVPQEKINCLPAGVAKTVHPYFKEVKEMKAKARSERPKKNKPSSTRRESKPDELSDTAIDRNPKPPKNSLMQDRLKEALAASAEGEN